MTPSPLTSRHILETAITALTDMKGRDIRIFDTHARGTIFDTIVVCSGTSQRHLRSLADEVYVQCKLAGVKPLSMEGERNGEWVLVDAGGVVINVMLPIIRSYYALEELWGRNEIDLLSITHQVTP